MKVKLFIYLYFVFYFTIMKEKKQKTIMKIFFCILKITQGPKLFLYISQGPNILTMIFIIIKIFFTIINFLCTLS